MKRLFTYLVSFSLLVQASAQGNVGIGTTTPAEKLDVNGAVIITGAGVAATPIPGTIRWNSAGGYHEGRTSSGTWIKLQNDEDILNGDYTALLSTCPSPITVGTFETSNPATGYSMASTTTYLESPFNTWWGGDRTQLLFRASELTAAGLCAGEITGIGWVFTSPGAYSIGTYSTLTIKMKNTTTNSLTSYETGLTSVYVAASAYTGVVGNNDFTFTTPFTWDGTSNIVVETCWNNNILALSPGVIIQIDQGYSFNTAYGYYQDLQPNICTIAGSPETSTSRPVTRFLTTVSTSVTGTDDYYQFYYPWVVGNPVLYYGAVHNGPGSVTADAVYDDNTLLSDFVFDAYFDGAINTEDKEAADGYRRHSIEELEQFVSTYRHLPTIPGREKWETSGMFSIGELLTDIWVSVEDQALYIKELHDAISSMETLIRENKSFLVKKLETSLSLIQNDAYISEETKVKQITKIQSAITLLNNM
jgi:hypothetical protein